MPSSTLARTPTQPLLRFRPDVHGRVRLRTGDVTFLAETVGALRSTICHILRGRRSGLRHGLRAKLEAVIGIPLERVDPPRRVTPPIAGRRRPYDVKPTPANATALPLRHSAVVTAPAGTRRSRRQHNTSSRVVAALAELERHDLVEAARAVYLAATARSAVRKRLHAQSGLGRDHSFDKARS